MEYKEIQFKLKDGHTAIFKSPTKEMAKEMLAFVRQASGETDFLMRYPEEYDDYTIEKEEEFISGATDNPDACMIMCFIDGKIAGNCQITFSSGIKDGHRASVAIGILQEFWGIGIGTRMFEEMIRLAKERGTTRQIELDFVEGNTRARALYEKMGFRITGIKPDAVRFKDGRFVNKYMMVKVL